MNSLGLVLARNPQYQRLLRNEVLQEPHKNLYQAVEKPLVTPAIRQRLLERLFPDISKLEAYTGWDLREWYAM